MLNNLTPNDLFRMLLSLSKSGRDTISCWMIKWRHHMFLLQTFSIKWWKYQCHYVKATINRCYCEKFGLPSLLIVSERLWDMGWTFLDYVTVWKRGNTFLKYSKNRTERWQYFFVIMPKMEYNFYCKQEILLNIPFGWLSNLTSYFIYPYEKSFLTIPFTLASQWNGTVYEERYYTWDCA